MKKGKNKEKTVLVTGGAGFIGSHLADRLLKENYKVVVLDNLTNGRKENLNLSLKNRHFKFIKGDILSKHDCLESTKNVDYVFHLACLGVRHSLHSPFNNHRVNAEGTLNMLEASVKNSVSRFIYISSSEIYGNVNRFPITETTIPNPTTIYGSSKLAGELYTQSYNYCYGLSTTIIRLFNNYGPKAHYEGDAGEIIPRTIVYALYNKSPVIFGDGKITRDYIYVKDAVIGLAKLLKLKSLPTGVINFGSGKELAMIDLIKLILKLTGKEKLPIKFLKSRPGDVKRLWVNSNKFNKLTGLKPSFSLNQGLEETIKYYQEVKKSKNLISEIRLKNWL